MIIVIHVAIALLGILSATFGYVRPTPTNLRISYAFIALTFGSGFYLVLSEPSQMIRACLSGIAYLAVVTAAVVLAKRKMESLQGSSI